MSERVLVIADAPDQRIEDTVFEQFGDDLYYPMASDTPVTGADLTNVRPLHVLADDEVAVKAADLRAGVRPSAGAAFWPETRRLHAALDAYDAARTPQIEEPPLAERVLEVLRQLDGSHKNAVALITGLSVEELDELGGVPE